MIETLSRGLYRLERVMVWTSLALGLAIVVLTVLELVLRATGVAFYLGSELNGFLFASLIYLALPEVTRLREHINIDMLLALGGPGFRRTMSVILNLISAFFCLFLLYVVYNFVASNFRGMIRSQDLLSLPLWYVQAPLLLGIGVTALRFLFCAIRPEAADENEAEHAQMDMRGHV